MQQGQQELFEEIWLEAQKGLGVLASGPTDGKYYPTLVKKVAVGESPESPIGHRL